MNSIKMEVTTLCGVIVLLAAVANAQIKNGLLGAEYFSTRLAWSDRGSGADQDFSCFQTHALPFSNREFDVGHHGQRNHNGQSDIRVYGFLTLLDATSLAAPTTFQFIWNDKGSGADHDGTIWRPVCPAGYVSVGDVMLTAGYSSAAPTSLYEFVRCVKEQYVVTCPWGGSIWKDSGSGADRDVEVFGLNCPTGRIGGFFYASPTHGVLPQTNAFAIDAQYVRSVP